MREQPDLAVGNALAAGATHAQARPWVVVSVTASTDGRLTLSRGERLLGEAANKLWRDAWPPDAEELIVRVGASIDERHHATVFLEGSGSFVERDASPLGLPPGEMAVELLLSHYLPHVRPRWFVVVDSRGRVPWTYLGDEQTGLLVLVCRSTPTGYLADLRQRRIPYLVTGDERVDLYAALVAIRAELGADCVVSEGGGDLNGALLRAGLVDELHLVTLPCLVGGHDTPSVMDGPTRPAGLPPLALRLVDVEVGEHGTIWSHYEVSGSAAEQTSRVVGGRVDPVTDIRGQGGRGGRTP